MSNRRKRVRKGRRRFVLKRISLQELQVLYQAILSLRAQLKEIEKRVKDLEQSQSFKKPESKKVKSAESKKEDMKICFTSTGSDLNSQIDPRFGRCQYFIFVEPATLEYKAVENLNREGARGVGVQSAQSVINEGARVVLTGNIGPNAYQVLNAATVKIITGITGTIKDAIERYRKGEIK